MTRTLSGRRILVVEDEAIVAHFIRNTLEDAGATVVGVAGDLFEAHRILDGTGVEAAVIDLHLRGSTGHSLAYLLSMRKTPVLFVTGHPTEASRAHPDAMVLHKPFSAADLIASVEVLLNGSMRAQRATANFC